jgi:ADP-heptose:LPS heptosyltransferase
MDNKGKVLMILGGGIGNIVQATPAIQAIASEKWIVDLKLECNSSKDIYEIFNLPCVRNIIKGEVTEEYTYQLNGPFTSGKKYNCQKTIRPNMNYAQHIPEAKIYFSMAIQMGITAKLPDAKIIVPSSGYDPPKGSVAIYPGSKHNWAMKRWDKYDELAKEFKHVVLVGTKKDITSHGDPTWIKNPWKWPKNVETYQGTLAEQAYTISKCDIFIGNDGGLGHVAAATGIPTFILFGPSSNIKNKPFTKHSYVIAMDLECRPCQFVKLNGKSIFDGGKSNCPHEMKCMKDMSVDYVLKRIKEITK